MCAFDNEYLNGFPYLNPDDTIEFPNPAKATKEGVVSVGGNLSPGFLLSAYRQGLFPWYCDGEPILWWSPDPRFVLYTDLLHIPRSMKKFLKKNPYRHTVDRCFEKVMRRCGSVKRSNNAAGTWITEEMVQGYTQLHREGYAHSFETWDGDSLVGGLYGVSVGGCFFGESMFSVNPNASKASFIAMVLRLREEGTRLIDCQQETHYLGTFGAQCVDRKKFIEELTLAVKAPTLRGRWTALLRDYPSSARWDLLTNRLEEV